jgi:hypothetical protein
MNDRAAVHDLLELRVRAGRSLTPDKGFARMVADKKALNVAAGTLARVVQRHGYGPDGESVEPCLEIRILEGPLHDRVGCVLLNHVALIEPQTLDRLRAQRRRAAEQKVAAALQVAENLEKSGKTDAARKAYRLVVKEYPGTEQAERAAGRVRSLGGR